MNRKLLSLAAGALVVTAAATTASTMNAQERQNPFLQPYGTEFDIPPFDRITTADYLPAFEAGIAQARAEIQKIADNTATPTFDNTIVAMDMAGDILTRVSRVFYGISEADSSPELVALDEVISPMVSKYSDEVMMNDKLFDRVKYLYDTRDRSGLTPEQKLSVEKHYKTFVRSGALLTADKKAELSDINTKLASLYLTFNKNLLNATNAFVIYVDDEARLAGLPEQTVAAAAAEAKSRGGEHRWAFTLHAPSRLAVLQYAKDRNLREQMWRGYTTLAQSGETNNIPIISDILGLRSQKARLLGYNDFAAYMTDNVMAKTPEAAEHLLMEIWKPAVNRVGEEVAEMQAVVDSEGGDFKIQPWDYYYYAEKVRKLKYDLDENEVMAYFPLENVRKGIFTMAERLYGIRFTELPDAPKYHPDVKVYEVTDTQGNHVAIFMTDYYTRPSKRQGAWMDEMKSSYVAADGTAVRPIIYNVCNFNPPTDGKPALLTMDDVETMFHEFGHGLHGMLSRAKYRSQSGTAVDRDFVELPSQIHEHWAFEPEMLSLYAFHYETGEPIPAGLIDKIQAAGKHNQGFVTTELVGAAILDLKYGHLNPEGATDVMGFEAGVSKEIGMPAQLTYRYRPTYFKHVFGSDGYASGYYTYLWAEVLDCDGFEHFAETGIFNPETARSFKENILEAGGSADPMGQYVKFRGHEPEVDALLRNRGLERAADAPADPENRIHGDKAK